MSHITVGKTKYKYTNKELLLKAMEGLGKIEFDQRMDRFGASRTSLKYDIVLCCPNTGKRLLSWNLNRHGEFVQYEEAMATRWMRDARQLIQDRYCAYTYQKQLVDEGYHTTVVERENGLIEVEALEVA